MNVSETIRTADTGGSDVTFLVIVGLVVLVAWLLSLRAFPYTNCSSCDGAPKISGGLKGKSFRLCGTCGGTGRRSRFMAGIWSRNRG